MREMRIWRPNAAKYYKNAGKFFPDEGKVTFFNTLVYTNNLIA